MRVINRLKPPGEIRSVRLNLETVIVHTDDEVIVYRRVEDVQTSSERPLRRSTLH